MGVQPGLGTGSGQEVGQVDRIAFLQIGKCLVFPTFRNDPRDITSCSAFEAGAAPTANEKATGTIAVHVGNPSTLNEVFLFLCETRPIGGDPVDEQLSSPPVAHHGNVVVLCGPTRFLEEHGSGSRPSSHVDKCGDDLTGVAFEELGIAIFTGLNLVNKPHVPPSTVIRVPAGEHVHERIDRDVVYVAQAIGVCFQLRSIRSHSYNPPPVHGQLFPVCTGGIDKAKIAYSDVNPSINPHAYPIGRVIYSASLIEFAGADLFDQVLGRAICHSICILVLKNG